MNKQITMPNVNILDPNLSQTYPKLAEWRQGMRNAGYSDQQIQVYFQQQLHQQPDIQQETQSNRSKNDVALPAAVMAESREQRKLQMARNIVNAYSGRVTIKQIMNMEYHRIESLHQEIVTRLQHHTHHGFAATPAPSQYPYQGSRPLAPMPPPHHGSISSAIQNEFGQKRKLNEGDGVGILPPHKKQRVDHEDDESKEAEKSCNCNHDELIKENETLKQEVAATKLQCNREREDLMEENEMLKNKVEEMSKESLIAKLDNIDSLNVEKLNELEVQFELKLKSIREAKESLMENKLFCIACMKNEKNVMIPGCHHVDLCNECEEKTESKICPRCQAPYTHAIKIQN